MDTSPTQQPNHMRASDADRDRVMSTLGDALAEGRLTPEEHSERMDAVYRAKTLGELAPVTKDLPEGLGSGAGGWQVRPYASEEALEMVRSSQGRENIVAVFGGADRSGRWLVEPHTNVSLLFGGVHLDLREAVLAQREVTIQCALLCGGLNITVPHGIRVVNQTTAILGGTHMNGVDTITSPQAPTVRLTGTCLLGGINVEAKHAEPGQKKEKRKGGCW